MKLKEKNLVAAAEQLSVPSYNRKNLKGGIVHIGVGGFHRAHQAVVIQTLLESGENNDWGICGIGLRKEDHKIAEVFDKQDCLYTLITRHPDGKVESEVMGQMTDFLFAPDDKNAVIERIASRDTRIVSLTITEGGYNMRSDGEFDLNHPDIQHELRYPDDPRTIYGYLASALRKRKENGQTPFTVMSCDNIQHNGDVIRKMLLAFLSAHDMDLALWVKSEVAFPNSMVDRITPVTTAAEMDYLKEQFNLEDEWPVTCEPFLQWVIEDNFSNVRPDFDQVKGVQFVSDVTPYEKMKIRLLNAGHSVLGIFGALMGIQTIDACTENLELRRVLRKFWDQEASPILDEVEGIDLDEYKDSLLERFANPNIKDKVSRICSESSAKLPKFILSTISENLQKGGKIEIATLLIVTCCYYYDKQIDQNEQKLEISDVMADQLHQAAKKTANDPLSFIRVREVFGELTDNQSFTGLYMELIHRFYERPEVSFHLE